MLINDIEIIEHLNATCRPITKVIHLIISAAPICIAPCHPSDLELPISLRSMPLKIKEGLTNGDRVGLRGRGFLGGLSLCGVGWGLGGGATGGFPAGRGGRPTSRCLGPPWGDGAGLRGRTMLTGWMPLGT